MSHIRITYAIIISLASICICHAQMVPELNGARAAALGMAAVNSGDIWAIQNNIGALGMIEDPTLAMAYNTRLNIPELTTFGALLGYPLNSGTAAFSFTRFGKGAYSLTTASLGYSHKVSYISVGMKINYLQQAIEGFVSQGTLAIEAGGKAELFPKLHFGAHAYNLTQRSFSKESDNMIPVLLKAGLEYLPSDNITLLLQTLKDVDMPSRMSIGMEYQIIDALQIRTGIQTQPSTASMGLGFVLDGFQFDYGFRHHNTIGAAHHLAISYMLASLRK